MAAAQSAGGQKRPCAAGVVVVVVYQIILKQKPSCERFLGVPEEGQGSKFKGNR